MLYLKKKPNKNKNIVSDNKQSEKEKIQEQGLISNSDVLPEALLKQINTFLEKEVALQQNEKINRIKEKIADFAPLEAILKEWLKSFLVIGYTLEGQKFYMGSAKNQQENDALIEHMRSTFFNIINKDF